jgi:hypothetical protein
MPPWPWGFLGAWAVGTGAGAPFDRSLAERLGARESGRDHQSSPECRPRRSPRGCRTTRAGLKRPKRQVHRVPHSSRPTIRTAPRRRLEVQSEGRASEPLESGKPAESPGPAGPVAQAHWTVRLQARLLLEEVTPAAPGPPEAKLGRALARGCGACWAVDSSPDSAARHPKSRSHLP